MGTGLRVHAVILAVLALAGSVVWLTEWLAVDSPGARCPHRSRPACRMTATRSVRHRAIRLPPRCKRRRRQTPMINDGRCTPCCGLRRSRCKRRSPPPAIILKIIKRTVSDLAYPPGFCPALPRVKPTTLRYRSDAGEAPRLRLFGVGPRRSACHGLDSRETAAYVIDRPTRY